MFETGVPGLEDIVKNALRPGTLVLVTGYPGAGKTTFAVTMCYANAMKGLKTIYFSYQEDKSKLYSMMSRYGIDLTSLESKGLFKYVHIPLIKQPEDILAEISSLTSENPSIIVLDSINPLIEMLKEDIDRRAFLRNFFAELARNIDGIVILIGEIPFGETSLSFGGIEFVADIVFHLKYRIERGLLVRHLELRKVRQAPVFISEIPISITENVGLRAWVPPVLNTINHVLAKPLILPSKLLSSAIENLRPSDHVYVTHPPENEDPFIYLVFLSMILVNKAKAVMITYKRSPESFKMWIKRTLSREKPPSNKLIEVLENHLIIYGVNPFSYSSSQLVALETDLVRKHNPDIVIFHGIELPYFAINRDQYLSLIYNEVNYHKVDGRLVVRIGGAVEEDMVRINSSIADVIINLESTPSNGGSEPRVTVTRKGLPHRTFTSQEIEEILAEMRSILF